MSNIQKFDVTQAIRDRVRAALFDSIPDEQMDAMIQSELKAFFSAPPYSRDELSPFAKLVRDELTAIMKNQLRPTLESYARTYWAEHGETAMQDFVAQFAAQAYQYMMAELIKQAFFNIGFSVQVNKY